MQLRLQFKLDWRNRHTFKINTLRMLMTKFGNNPLRMSKLLISNVYFDLNEIMCSFSIQKTECKICVNICIDWMAVKMLFIFGYGMLLVAKIWYFLFKCYIFSYKCNILLFKWYNWSFGIFLHFFLFKWYIFHLNSILIIQ